MIIKCETVCNRIRRHTSGPAPNCLFKACHYCVTNALQICLKNIIKSVINFVFREDFGCGIFIFYFSLKMYVVRCLIVSLIMINNYLSDFKHLLGSDWLTVKWPISNNDWFTNVWKLWFQFGTPRAQKAVNTNCDNQQIEWKYHVINQLRCHLEGSIADRCERARKTVTTGVSTIKIGIEMITKRTNDFLIYFFILLNEYSVIDLIIEYSFKWTSTRVPEYSVPSLLKT